MPQSRVIEALSGKPRPGWGLRICALVSLRTAGPFGRLMKRQLGRLSRHRAPTTLHPYHDCLVSDLSAICSKHASFARQAWRGKGQGKLHEVVPRAYRATGDHGPLDPIKSRQRAARLSSLQHVFFGRRMTI